MAAKFFHQIVAGLQGGKHVKLRDAPSRAANHFVVVVFVGADEDGHAVALHQPRGDNADDAVVPVGLNHHQDAIALNIHRPRGPLLLAPGDRLLLNALAEVLAGGIDLLALHRPLQGHPDIVGGQQVDHNLRLADPAHGVDPWA